MSEQIKNELDIIEISEELIKAKTYEIRGLKVMLDHDLAVIYGYSTKRFNEQVNNNRERFVDDFMFKLTREEVNNLRSKNSTSSWGGLRYLPHAFTEQGIYMLMTVLKGELAIKQSIALIRTFKKMKDYIVENQNLIGQREYLQLSMQISSNLNETIELRHELTAVEDQVADVVDKLSDIVYKSELSDIMKEFGDNQIKRGYLLLNGQPFNADVAYYEIYSHASSSIFIVDNYIGIKTLEHLIGIMDDVDIIVFSDNIHKGLRSVAYDDFHTEYPKMKIEFRKTCGIFHDRYIVIDYGTNNEKIYHCGASSKDAGNRVTSITKIEDSNNYHAMIEKLLSNPILKLN